MTEGCELHSASSVDSRIHETEHITTQIINTKNIENNGGTIGLVGTVGDAVDLGYDREGRRYYGFTVRPVKEK